MLLSQELRLGQQAEGPRPLSVAELEDIERRLTYCRLTVGNLLEDASLQHDPDIVGNYNEHIGALMERGLLLAMCQEKWSSRAITAYSRCQPEYPLVVPSRMGYNALPVLYCVGDGTKMNTEHVGFLAPRSRDQAVIAYAARIGGAMTQTNTALVSGVGKLTEAALASAAPGTLGIVRGKLEQTAIDRHYRDAVMNGQLTLVSASDPAVRQSDVAVDQLIDGFANRLYAIEPGPPPAYRKER